VVSDDGHISTHDLKVGVVTDNFVEVLDGLKAGNKIFVPE